MHGTWHMLYERIINTRSINAPPRAVVRPAVPLPHLFVCSRRPCFASGGFRSSTPSSLVVPRPWAARVLFFVFLAEGGIFPGAADHTSHCCCWVRIESRGVYLLIHAASCRSVPIPLFVVSCESVPFRPDWFDYSSIVHSTAHTLHKPPRLRVPDTTHRHISGQKAEEGRPLVGGRFGFGTLFCFSDRERSRSIIEK